MPDRFEKVARVRLAQGLLRVDLVRPEWFAVEIVAIQADIAEEDKERICADLGLTSMQFNSVISRALKRFKELYLKRFGKF